MDDPIGAVPLSRVRIIIPFLLKKKYPLVMSKKLLKMAIEIVDFPINSMVIFHSYVSLPEGNGGVK